MIKAVIFDLDGVLIDSMNWHSIAFNRAVKKVANYNVSKRETEELNGLPTKEKLRILSERLKLKTEELIEIFNLKQKYTLEIIRNNKILDQNKIQMMEWLFNKNIKIGCYTNAITETAELILEQLKIRKYVKSLISNQTVRFPKPHAEGYIKCMINLNAYPEETLIVEDHIKGITAAKGTGAWVWEVSSSNEVTHENLERKIREINDYCGTNGR